MHLGNIDADLKNADWTKSIKDLQASLPPGVNVTMWLAEHHAMDLPVAREHVKELARKSVTLDLITKWNQNPHQQHGWFGFSTDHPAEQHTDTLEGHYTPTATPKEMSGALSRLADHGMTQADLNKNLSDMYDRGLLNIGHMQEAGINISPDDAAHWYQYEHNATDDWVDHGYSPLAQAGMLAATTAQTKWSYTLQSDSPYFDKGTTVYGNLTAAASCAAFVSDNPVLPVTEEDAARIDAASAGWNPDKGMFTGHIPAGVDTMGKVPMEGGQQSMADMLAAGNPIHASDLSDQQLGKYISMSGNALVPGVNVGYPDSLARGVMIARGADPTVILAGPKEQSFMNNIAFPNENTTTTIDSHMAAGILGADFPKSQAFLTGGGYKLLSDTVLGFATSKGILGNQAQAVAWVADMNIASVQSMKAAKPNAPMLFPYRPFDSDVDPGDNYGESISDPSVMLPMVVTGTTVRKYNQNHDEHGRFASGDGGGAQLTDSAVAAAVASDPGGYVVDGVLHTDNVEAAAQALSQGADVQLQQVREVSSLLTVLHDQAVAAQAAGKEAAPIDLAKVTVPGTNLFAAMAIVPTRLEMPQLATKDPVPGSVADGMPRSDRGEVDLTSAYVESLRASGVSVQSTTEQPAFLRATQDELGGRQVGGMMTSIQNGNTELAARPIVISSDNYILDGHHTWAANVGVDSTDNILGNGTPMNVTRVGLPITDLLASAQSFADTMGIPNKRVGKLAKYNTQHDAHGRFAEGAGILYGEGYDTRGTEVGRTPLASEQPRWVGPSLAGHDLTHHEADIHDAQDVYYAEGIIEGGGGLHTYLSQSEAQQAADAMSAKYMDGRPAENYPKVMFVTTIANTTGGVVTSDQSVSGMTRESWPIGGPATIQLTPQGQTDETLMHEVAHVASYYNTGYSGHGESFRNQLVTILNGEGHGNWARTIGRYSSPSSAYTKSDRQPIASVTIDGVTTLCYGPDRALAKYNQNHDERGRFTDGGAVITADEARGNSRAVPLSEFHALAHEGRAQLATMKENATAPAALQGHQWESIKASAYAAAQSSWGGQTIDAHTGALVPDGANQFALSIKEPGQDTVKIPEGASYSVFSAAMDSARNSFPQLANEGAHLGVFHDDSLGQIHIDPSVVVNTVHEVEAIGAATHAIGGAYNFADGNGYFPPHVV